jgi:hypothetical protein
MTVEEMNRVAAYLVAPHPPSSKRPAAVRPEQLQRIAAELEHAERPISPGMLPFAKVGVDRRPDPKRRRRHRHLGFLQRHFGDTAGKVRSATLSGKIQ